MSVLKRTTGNIQLFPINLEPSHQFSRPRIYPAIRGTVENHCIATFLIKGIGFRSKLPRSSLVKTRILQGYVLLQLLHYIHTYIIFRCSPQGFSATCLQQMQGSVVEGLSQTATSGSQWFFVWDIRLCPQLAVHNTGISLLLSTSVWVLLSPPMELRETRPTA